MVNISSSSSVRPTGIFVSSMKYVGEPAQKDSVETTQPVVTETGDSSQQMELRNTQDDGKSYFNH